MNEEVNTEWVIVVAADALVQQPAGGGSAGARGVG